MNHSHLNKLELYPPDKACQTSRILKLITIVAQLVQKQSAK